MLGDGPLPEAPGGTVSLENIDKGARMILDELLGGAAAQTSVDKDAAALLEKILGDDGAAAAEAGDGQEESVAGEQPGAEEAPAGGEAEQAPGEAGNVPDEAEEIPGEAEDISGEAEQAPGEAEDVSEEAVEIPDEAEDVSGEAGEVSMEAGEPGEEPRDVDMPAVLLACAIDTGKLIVGETVVTLTAAVEGVPEGCEYTLQWQNNLTGAFEDVPGETGDCVTFVASEENIHCEWRALLVLPGENFPVTGLSEPLAPEAAVPEQALP